jgi:predicted Zn-dependent peptidase
MATIVYRHYRSKKRPKKPATPTPEQVANSKTEALLDLLDRAALARRVVVILAGDPNAGRVEQYLEDLEAKISKLTRPGATPPVP